MKLYRGLKNSEYIEFDERIANELKNGWRKVLVTRERGDLLYPEDMNKEILRLAEIHNLTHQHFTDNEEIATNYAKQEKGLLIEIELSTEDILKYFTIEFQNFSKRRERFELVYVVSGKDLAEHSKDWKLTVKNHPITD